MRLAGDYNLQILVSSSYPLLGPSHKSVFYYYCNELQLNSKNKHTEVVNSIFFGVSHLQKLENKEKV